MCAVLLGALKEWSLVIYGTSENPYQVNHRSVRSVEPNENDFMEEYNGKLNEYA